MLFSEVTESEKLFSKFLCHLLSQILLSELSEALWFNYLVTVRLLEEVFRGGGKRRFCLLRTFAFVAFIPI